MEKAKASGRRYAFNDGTDRIIGAAIRVHKQLGPGFQEVVYQRALALELTADGVEFEREANIPVFYQDRQIDTRRVDFVIGDCLLEIKARKEFLKEDFVQTISYLKSSGYRVALLINFGAGRIQIRRYMGPAALEQEVGSGVETRNARNATKSTKGPGPGRPTES